MNNKVKHYYILGVSVKELSVLYNISISEIANILDLAGISDEELRTRTININARIQIELIDELNQLNDRFSNCTSISHVLYLKMKRSALQAALEKLA